LKEYRQRGVNGEIKKLLHLKKQEHVQRFFELVDLVRKLDPRGEETMRIDDGVIEKVLASPDIIKELYHHAPEKFRSLIENDVTADDVYALASRRKAVEKFSQMLTDDEYFDSLIATEGSGKPEGVWQLFFEKNPLDLRRFCRIAASNLVGSRKAGASSSWTRPRRPW
jgi:hypothetical protein